MKIQLQREKDNSTIADDIETSTDDNDDDDDSNEEDSDLIQKKIL